MSKRIGWGGAAWFVAALVACGGGGEAWDGGTDAATDALPSDLGTSDAGGDASPAMDAGSDAGPEPCPTPGATETVACGSHCGTVDRFCDASHLWDYGVCMDHGVCIPGTTRTAMCAAPVTERCDTSCSWTGGCGLDVIVLLDSTGNISPSELSSGAQSSLMTGLVMPLLASTAADVRVGVAYFSDFPTLPFGSPGDVVFAEVQAPTATAAMVQTAVMSVPMLDGYDVEEGGVVALSELAGGATSLPDSSLRLTCAAGLEGGGCFRPGSQRAVVVVSDANFHNAPAGALVPYDATVAGAPTWADTRTRLAAAHLDVFALSDTAAVPMWTAIETDLGSTRDARVVTVDGLATGPTDWGTDYAAVLAKLRAAYGLGP